MTILRLRANRMVNLGKQPDGKLLYWTVEDVEKGVVKEAEVTPLIERYINDGLLEVVEKKPVKKERVGEKKPVRGKKTRKKA